MSDTYTVEEARALDPATLYFVLSIQDAQALTEEEEANPGWLQQPADLPPGWMVNGALQEVRDVLLNALKHAEGGPA